jgi:ribosomal protein S18 acetylase RimI-like enzyme
MPYRALRREPASSRTVSAIFGDIRRALTGPASTVLAGTEDGSVVATAMVGHDGHRGWVYYLAVVKEARGRGLGRAIMQACQEWLRERGVPKLNIMVRGDNIEARGFYEKLDYGHDHVVVLSRLLHLGTDP